MMLRYIVAVLLAVVPLQVYAVNKCFIDGKTAYQDKPCPNEGMALENIHPETDAEKSRREQDAAVVTHNLGESNPFSASHDMAREHAPKQKQRRAVRDDDSVSIASGYRGGQRSARAGSTRKKQRAVKSKLKVMRGL